MPEDLISEQGRFLYQIVHDRLAEDADLSIDALTSDLAMRGRTRLCDWVTTAESMVEQETAGQDDVLRQVVSDAAAAIRGHHHDQEDQRARRALAGIALTDGDRSAQEQAMRRVHETRRGQRSPLAIARVTGSTHGQAPG